MRRRISFLTVIALAVLYLLMQARPTKADVTQTKTLISSGGIHSAAGNITMTTNVGEVLSGHSTGGNLDVWHGFYGPILTQLVDVHNEPRVTFISFLSRISPNPARASAVIEFGNAVRQSVELSLYDVAGRRVRQLYAGDLHAGVFRTRWDLRSDAGTAVSAGVYFVRLSAGNVQLSERMVIVR